MAEISTGAAVVNLGVDRAEQTPVSTDRVTKWVLEYTERAKQRAVNVSRTHIWDRIDAENNAYGLRDKTLEPQEAGIKAANLDQEYEVLTKDLSDQVDEMTALLTDMITRGEIRRYEPRPGIPEEQAELTKKVQDALLKEKDWDAEVRTFAGRFVRHCVAGFRVCRSHEVSYITERVEVPVREQVVGGFGPDGMPVMQEIPVYTDDALLQRGFTPDQIRDGSAIRSALAEDKGLTFVGIADLREDGTFQNLLCTRCRETKQDFVYLRTINPRRIAIADPTRPFKKQPTVHEFSYLTANELRSAHYRNIDKLEKDGSPISDTNSQNPGSTVHVSTTSGNLIVPVYEKCESWLELPFEKAVRDGEFSEEELRVFLIENGIPVEEVRYPSYKWVVHHNCDKVLLGIETSYRADKSQHAFLADSFVHADGEATGNSLMERLSNVCSNLLAFLNMTARGIKKNLYGSRIISDRIGMSESDIKRLDQFGGTVVVEGNLTDVEAEIHTMQFPDVSRMGMGMVQLFEDKKRGLGVPSILAGEGQAETATQDSINNQRGQTVVNDAFRRMRSLLCESYMMHLDVMVNSFTQARYINIMGEDGATMTRRWTMPREITDKLDIVPMMSFNDAEKQRMIQFLLGLMNVVAPVMGPGAVKSLLVLSMEKFGIDQSDIAKIEESEGSLTSVQQEIETMLQDPQYQVKVRMEDPHSVCIQMAQMAMAQEASRYESMGAPPPPMDNLMEYVQIHEGMLEQQRLMEAMQQMMAGGGPGLQGKPVQGRSDGGPGDEEGGARQTGQAVGVGNQGPMSAAGLTGQGSPGLIKGAPAGI